MREHQGEVCDAIPDAHGTSVSATFSAIGSKEIQVSWGEPSDGGEVATYEVHYRQCTSGGWNASTDITQPNVVISGT